MADRRLVNVRSLDQFFWDFGPVSNAHFNQLRVNSITSEEFDRFVMAITSAEATGAITLCYVSPSVTWRIR
jgi:hypothetical protein